ncbi:hypothetical protein V6N13_083185 [Hibiscus sabdariffa]
MSKAKSGGKGVPSFELDFIDIDIHGEPWTSFLSNANKAKILDFITSTSCFTSNFQYLPCTPPQRISSSSTLQIPTAKIPNSSFTAIPRSLNVEEHEYQRSRSIFYRILDC